MDRFFRNRNSAIASLVVVAIVFFFIGSFFGGGQVSGEPQKNIVNTDPSSGEVTTDVDFAPFWKTWNQLNEKFVAVATTTQNLTDQDKVWGAIVGLAASYGDPYTVFFPPEDSTRFESDIRGNFEGVGMEIDLRGGAITVVAPLKGTPAYKAGILAGDRIIKIDDVSAVNMSVEEAVKYIRGPKGSKVVLTVVHKNGGDSIEVPIIRDVINIPTIDNEKLDSGVYIIRLYNFSSISADLFRGALRDFALSGSDKLILDLRGNPGGYLEAAVDMASWFLPGGKTIVSEDFGGKRENIVHRSKGYDAFNDNLKMVVLVDGGSASASEILAGALSENGIATLVGSKTFGKGSVQELVKITPDTSLKVTIARWLTPKGNSISVAGLKPQIEVERTAEDFKEGRDPQLDRAVKFLLAK